MPRRAFILTWRGKQVEDTINQATIAGMNETLQAATEAGKGNAPVDTGALRDDIDYQPAAIHGSRITGQFGNWTVSYAIFQEVGTIHIAPKFYLRRAADQEFPHTAERIKAHVSGS